MGPTSGIELHGTQIKIITGPPTHSAGSHTSNGRWCLASSASVTLAYAT